MYITEFLITITNFHFFRHKADRATGKARNFLRRWCLKCLKIFIFSSLIEQRRRWLSQFPALSPLVSDYHYYYKISHYHFRNLVMYYKLRYIPSNALYSLGYWAIELQPFNPKVVDHF